MTFRIFVLMLILCGTKAALAKPLCTFTETLMKPGRGNSCLAQLIAGAKFSKDKILLQKIATRWNPPKDLSVKAIPGGYQLFRGEKMISQAAWIKLNPPILFWNGSIRSLPESAGSVGETIEKLLASQKRTAWLDLLPRAEAEGTATLETDFLTLFTTREMEFVHAGEATHAKPGFRFPQISGAGDWSGRGLQCGQWGVNDMMVRLKIRGIEREVRFRAVGQSTWVVNGYLDDGDKGSGQGVFIEYKPKPSRDWSCHKRSSTLSEYDRKFCRPLWEKFFAENPAAADEYRRSQMCLWCGGFSSTNHTECDAFFERNKIDVTVYPLPDLTGKNSKDGNPSITAWRCEDAECKGLGQLQDERDGLSEFEDAVAGAAVLGECCKSEACRNEASKQLRLNLKPTAGNGAVH